MQPNSDARYHVMKFFLIFFLHGHRCIEHNIHVLNLPAHTTHLLQVADIAVFGPFKKHITSSLTVWRSEHGETIFAYQMAAATCKAWEKSTSRANCIAGFEKAGIVPFDRNKITEKNYKEGIRHRRLRDDSSRYAPPPVPSLPPCDLDLSSSSSVPSSSPAPVVETISSILTLPQPLPLPSPTQRKSNSIVTTFAVMLTETQVINALKQKQEEKERKEREKQEKKRVREEKKQQQALTPKPQLRKLKPTGIRLTNRLSNKENTPPASSNNIIDPYDFSTN